MTDHERAAMLYALERLKNASHVDWVDVAEGMWKAARAYVPPRELHTETYTLTCCKKCGAQWPCLHAPPAEAEERDTASDGDERCGYKIRGGNPPRGGICNRPDSELHEQVYGHPFTPNEQG